MSVSKPQESNANCKSTTNKKKKKLHVIGREDVPFPF